MFGSRRRKEKVGIASIVHALVSLEREPAQDRALQPIKPARAAEIIGPRTAEQRANQRCNLWLRDMQGRELQCFTSIDRLLCAQPTV